MNKGTTYCGAFLIIITMDSKLTKEEIQDTVEDAEHLIEEIKKKGGK